MHISAFFHTTLEILRDGGEIHLRFAVHPVKEESLSRLISYIVVMELSVSPSAADAFTSSPDSNRVVRVIG